MLGAAHLSTLAPHPPPSLPATKETRVSDETKAMPIYVVLVAAASKYPADAFVSQKQLKRLKGDRNI